MNAIEEIKQRLDIVQVVSEYVALQKSGKNYRALCPFHPEKNPSFFVFPDRQSWHCFGACNAGGDIFSFVMRKEGIDFGEALRLLANKAGVSLITSDTHSTKNSQSEQERIYRVNEAAAAYYHHLLLNDPLGETARRYLAYRGVCLETIKNFQLGLSPQDWETLKNHLLREGYAEAELLAAGLLVEQEDKRTYDRFRGRLMFPIRNIDGKLVGFGARALDDSTPKYLNSPQTLVFDKSSILYGIDRAKQAIRQRNQAIIVEGYMDVIVAHQHGWENVVASMGTAITEAQLTTLKNLTRNFVFALDADAAGTEAIFRGGELINKVLSFSPVVYGWVRYEDAYKAEVKAVSLPDDKDPDEIIKENPELWRKTIDNARPIIDFIFDTFAAKVNIDDVTQKSLLVEKFTPLLLEIRDPIRRAHYVERLAKYLKIDQRVLEDTLRKAKALQKTPPKGHVPTDGLKYQVTITPAYSPLEQYCLALLLQYPELKAEATELSPECFEQSQNRELFLKWRQSTDVAHLKEKLDPALREYAESLLSKELPPMIRESEALQRHALQDCIIRLHEKRLRNLEMKKRELLATEAQIGGVGAELARLEEQGIESSKQLKEIFNKQSSLRQQLVRRGEK
jgi:DNA primase